MEWLILFTLVTYYGLQLALVREVNRRVGLPPEPQPDWYWNRPNTPLRGRLPGETSINDYTPEQIRTIMSHFSDPNRLKSRSVSEKVDWKNEGF